ncbi:hypothetical protein OSB04_006851 [Centaurea solstitialis]|uniref:CCHC-type domain-containing protein n=1 Tax=Centaurea solstitialis TaxID=347529 RepID=A0AA38TWK4_9ASTR|nr:hypothetical protein OSB04_006851 [Centaurea solstitialis]
MNKNLAEEDLHDLYSTLSQHEVKVKVMVTKQKTITDSLALLTEKNMSVFSSATKKKSHSKSLVTELSDFDLETIEDESSEFDVDLKRVVDKLALLSSSIHKRYGKKKFYSKPKFKNYKRDKYKPKEYEKRPERKSYEKGNTNEKGNVCFNCGKPGHFVKDCKAPMDRDFDYYSKKAQLAKCKSEGKVLMAEEECWYDDTSDNEDSAHFTQVHYNLIAGVEETINLHKETEVSNEVSQTPSDSDLSDNDESFTMEEEFSEIEEMKRNDPMFQDAKYHRVKYVYNSDNLRIKSKDSSNSFDFLVYLDIDSSQESNGISRLGVGIVHALPVVLNAKATQADMSQETDPSEYQSHGSPEHPRSENGAPRSHTAVQERDPYSDSDADSHRVPTRPVPATRTGLRVRTTARKSVPMPTQMTFCIPTGDGAGPSRVRGQGGSSSSSSASPPPYRPSSPIARVPRPPPVARPPPIAQFLDTHR